MRSTRHISPCALAALTLWALAAPTSAGEYQINYGGRSTFSYDSNVFYTGEDEFDDASARLGGWAEIEDPDGNLTWSLYYGPTYQAYLDAPDIDGWDHDVRAELGWRVNPLTQFEASHRYTSFRSVSRFNETLFQEGEAVAVTGVFDQSRLETNQTEVSLTHSLTPRDQLVFVADHLFRQFSQGAVGDRTTLGAQAIYQHTLDQRNFLGGFLSWRRQIFDATMAVDKRTTDFINLSGTWTHLFSPTLRLETAAGPALVLTDDAAPIPSSIPDAQLFTLVRTPTGAALLGTMGCDQLGDGTLFLSANCQPLMPPLLAEEIETAVDQRGDLLLIGQADEPSTENLTYFADLRLVKSWETVTGTLSYRRQDSSTSGIGVSTISDTVQGLASWRPSPRWRFQLNVAWIRETQSNDNQTIVVVVEPGELETTFPVMGLPFRLTRRNVARSAGFRAVTVSQDIERTNIVASLDIRFRLTRRTTLFGTGYYQEIDSDLDAAFLTRRSRYRVSVGVEYEFEPFKL